MESFNIVPSWQLQRSSEDCLHPQTLPLLLAITKTGRLTVAAKDVGLSYRHAWNILNNAEALVGRPLVLKEKGRGAELSAVGQALLSFNQRLEARLHPQFESLTTELNVELHRAAAELFPVVKVFASHGFAVAQLPKHAQNCQIEMHYHTPVEALIALNEGRCRVAGFHVSVGMAVDQLRKAYRQLLDPEKFGILRFVRRTQGWIHAEDRPVESAVQIAKEKLRFINREPKSGTRELFDQILKDSQVKSSDILGYENHEFTHSAVAAFIASNMADVGFGVEAAAHRFGLGFSPILEEAYLWAYSLEAEDDPDIKHFIQTLKNQSLIDTVASLPGYSSDQSGEKVSLDWVLSL